MIKHFLSLEWKSFFRSASFGKNVAMKIFMVFMAFYMAISFISLGVALFYILEDQFPDINPVLKVSEFLIYWVLYEMLLRYFMQKLPVLNIKPFLVLPISDKKITNYILGKSAFSFFNFLPLFAFIPFTVVLLFQGYPALNVLLWFVAIVFIILTLNFINFIINKNDKAFIIVLVVVASIIGLQYFEVVDIPKLTAPYFYALYENPLFVLIPAALVFITYRINFKYLISRLYLDQTLKKKTKEAKTVDLSWTKRFGSIAPFLQMDLRLIWRNKRPRTQAIMCFAFALYGLFMYTTGMNRELPVMLVLIGILMTGIFMINFGQFIPAWDSAYYNMIMAQNIPLRRYLDSKAGLMMASVVFMAVITTPYVYFGWDVLMVNLSCAVYNAGINIPIVLFFGSMNKKRIDLVKSSIGNMQGMGAAQWLVGIPLMIFPMVLYAILYYTTSMMVANIVFVVLGITGLLLREKLMTVITELYRKKKYAMVHGFQQKD
ncbi:DUF5687 family protein [Spongiivirga citrea]|uniref:Uncharacterized protein n=1 Tax=Spongiivirga citrea TaxID=1481457 RepID=A0A6M0CPS9_9FLAO|nr:DUF5687 family protein [Spongiivirga citrea]NER18933.1 hypothetical protein [Spongiivirga citrea]